MRKITFFIIGLFVVCSYTLQAQDLGVTMVSPANGATYTTTDNVTLTFTLTNYGTASLTNGDTVYFQLTGNGTPIFTVYLTLGSNTLASGQAANISMPSPIQIPVTGNNMPVCIVITRSTLGADPVSANNSSCVNITVTAAGIEEADVNSHISVYPNPSVGNLSIECDKEMINVSVFSSLGQKVFDSNVNDLSLQLNTENYQEGLYFVKIKTNTGVTTKKIIVRK